MHKRSRPALHVSIAVADPVRINVSGMHVGDICFECESRVEIVHSADGILLAWCECSWPDDHHLMEIARWDN
jgi:hypothetical protein